MATVPLQHATNEGEWKMPSRGVVAMASLITAESSIFTIFVVAYLFYAGKDLSGPTPRQILETPIFYTICLLSSSLTVHFAGRALHVGQRSVFLGLWLLTLVLGGLFLFGTGQEWHRLIYERNFTIATNLFGTTYYSLVGLHATHVVVGLIMLLIVLLFALAGRVGKEHSARVETLALYWHFVDCVWVVVFSVVYIIAR